MDASDLAAVVASTGVRDVVTAEEARAWGKGDVRVAVHGTMLVAGDECHIGVGLTTDFPDSLPRVFALSEQLRRLPHVESSGRVCATQDENVFHDHRRPEDLVCETLARAKNVLEDGLLGVNESDFVDEAEAYWKGEVNVPCVVAASLGARRLLAFYVKDKLVAVADTRAALAGARPELCGQERAALYLRLDGARTRGGHPDRLASWPDLFSELTDDSLALLEQTRVDRKRTTVVVLGIPRGEHDVALVGLVLKKFSGSGTLRSARPRLVQRVNLERYDAPRVRQRSMGSTAETRIAVIGCGAVGGHVAHALAWSTSKLILVDHDGYEPGNAARHVLGRLGWGAASKVTALQGNLCAFVPGLRVIPIPKTVDRALTEDLDLLRGTDAIVVAIGNPSVPLRMNDDFAAQRFPVPVIFTWLEPYGIGGHALLVRYGQPGCLRCVFHDEPQLHNVLDFAERGQTFAVHELGCHGRFTPYGDMDARETAIGAVRLVERVLREPTTPAWVRSWRGDAKAFREAGFQVSARHSRLSQGLEGPLWARTDCPTCGA